MKIKLLPDFKEFLELVNDNNVEYLLIGGYAVGYHGYHRTTDDLDVWIATKSTNVTSVLTVLRRFGYNLTRLSPDLFIEGNALSVCILDIISGVPTIRRIEILTKLSGLKFDECYAERIVDKINGVTANIISLEHLRINKKASGRKIDLDDLKNLPSKNPL